MKLRNKKTGQVGLLSVSFSSYQVIPIEKPLSLVFAEYETLDALMQEWEEYGEPLIKDGEIRDAIKTWADVNGFDRVYICNSYNAWGVRYDFEDACSVDILFRGEPPLEPGEQYSIEDLCGGEE